MINLSVLGFKNLFKIALKIIFANFLVRSITERSTFHITFSMISAEFTKRFFISLHAARWTAFCDMKLPTFAGRFAHEAHLLSVGSTEVDFFSSRDRAQIKSENLMRENDIGHLLMRSETTTNMEYFSNDFYLHWAITLASASRRVARENMFMACAEEKANCCSLECRKSILKSHKARFITIKANFSFACSESVGLRPTSCSQFVFVSG